MRIVYLFPSTIPSRSANSIHIMKMCQAFAKNGHEVILIIPDKKKDREKKIQDVYTYYGVDTCFEIIKIPWLKIKGLRRRFFALLAAIKAKNNRPSIVYTRCIFCCFFAISFGLSVIFEIHAPMENKKKIQKLLFSKVIKSSKLQNIVVITHSLKEHYEEKYPLREGLIRIAPDGADPVSKNAIPVVLPNKDHRLQVGYVGHLYKGKGFEEIVSRLPTICEFADFHILGGRDDLLNLYKKKYSKIKNLKFHGYMPHAKTVVYLLAFDIVLLPNQNIMYTSDKDRDIGQWTSPLKLFEYMAAGRPIIASNIPVLREILEDEGNALLCQPDDVQAWSFALKRLQDKDLRHKLGFKAYKDFMNNYTWKIRAQKILS